MFSKVKYLVLFAIVLGFSCLTLDFIGMNSTVNAEDIKVAQADAPASHPPVCPTTKPCDKKPCEKSPCDVAARHGHGHGHGHGQCGGCCGKSKQACGSKPGCGSASRCDKTGAKKHCGTVDDMMSLVHCAKKKLLKEKIMKKLDAKMGAKLDQVAGLLVDAMLEEYKEGRANKERKAELNKKLIEIFSGKPQQ